MAINKSVLKQKYWEYLIPALAVTSLLISCIIVSSKKFFWNDELLSFYLLGDYSLPHMLVAWSDKFNQAPPLYFITGWLWDKLFGSTELSLRIFSGVSMSLACILVWAVLRRTYDLWSTSIGTLSVFCLSDLVLYHNAELRMYGLFTAFCAFSLLQFDSINRKQVCSWKLLSINSLAHCAIVLTHLYGVFYSAATLAAFIVHDIYSGNFRKKVYLSVLSGWIVLIPLVPLIINQSNNSAKWFYAFKLSETINMLIPFPKFAWFILFLLIISIFLNIVKSDKNNRNISEQKNSKLSKQDSEISLLIIGAFFMMVPIGAWIITVTIKPLLNDRYILPTITISWSIFLSYLTSRIIPIIPNLTSVGINRFHFSNLRSILLLFFTLTLILYPIYYAKKFSAYSQKPGVNDLTYGYIELPIAMEAGHDFLPRFFYSPKPSRYFHILDWETAVNNVTSAYATGDYVHINALHTNYSFIQSIQSTDFLQKYNRFLVLNEEDQKWFETRIQNNTNYKIKKLGSQPGANAPLTMFLVERR